MTDSLLSGRNHHDGSLQHFDQINLTLLLEASTRRLSELKGPLYAAEKLQRLADICAGAHVMPLEHWQRSAQKAEPVAQSVKPKMSRFARFWTIVVENPAVVFWAGVLVGMWLGARR